MKIIKTKDGSNTIFLDSINETYHSIHGAILESKHVFINNGLFTINKKRLKILEIGLGTGLNTLLCINNIKDKTIFYTSIEPKPIDINIIEKLNYGEILNTINTFKKIHQSNWDEKIEIKKNFFLIKIKKTIQKYITKEKFDIIFFDAFAPNKQPEMYEHEIINKCYQLINRGGFLVTYCAQGKFKRTLNKIGFNVQTLNGPPGKREMVKAIRK